MELPGTDFLLDDAILSVGHLAQQIKRVLESDPILCDIGVRGEISNFKAHDSGHLYFTLKDADAQIRCCVWRRSAGRLTFRPADGNRVVASGRVEFYGARGEVSFIVEELRFDGRGALLEAYEQLKRDLAGEGLFDAARKRPLPLLPRRIGLITSPTGAAAHDVISILRRRWPVATIVFIPAAVQGFAAAPDLVRAIGWAGALGDLDLLIVTRGGGAIEDLWCFNDEDLARAAAACPIPLISAVGHETDFTILDFVADLRAPTPSAAAELATPDIEELRGQVNGARRRLRQAVSNEVRLARRHLETLRQRQELADPRLRLREVRRHVEFLRASARNCANRRVKIERQAVFGLHAQLRALDPQRVLERGYALVSDERSGTLIAAASDLRSSQAVRIRFQDGQVGARVEQP